MRYRIYNSIDAGNALMAQPDLKRKRQNGCRDGKTRD
jgi:hypothetical protein